MDPVTAAALAATTQIGGTYVEIQGQLNEGKAANKVAKYNAEIARRQGEAEKQQALAAARSRRREARLRLGSMRAKIGTSGVAVEGSPLLALTESAAEEELDALMIQHRGAVAKNRGIAKANLLRARGRMTRDASRTRALSTGINSITGISQSLGTLGQSMGGGQ